MNLIRKIIKEEINRFLISEVHLKEVDNFKDMADFVSETWSSPDDVWWIKIEQRFKDFKKYNMRHGGKMLKRWERVKGPDGTGRENHVGYVIVRGNTKEDAVNSILNAVVHLNPWAAKVMKTKNMYSNGRGEAILQVCNIFFARAYITINSREMGSTIARAKQDKKIGMFRGREFHHRVGQARTGVDRSGVDWGKLRPYGLVDCDVDNAQAQAWLENYFAGKGVKIMKKKPSHDGMHYIISIEDGNKCDWDYINRYMAKNYNCPNRPGDPPVLFKPDANIMLYSNVG
jgi:hypothetical protein